MFPTDQASTYLREQARRARQAPPSYGVREVIEDVRLALSHEGCTEERCSTRYAALTRVLAALEAQR